MSVPILSKSVQLESVFSSRVNYFDHMRLVAAFAVLVSHSIPITGTPETSVFHPLVELGYYAVAVFFFLSGYLITRSWLSCRSVPQFVVARFFRIYPGLWLALALTLLVLGPVTTTHQLPDYFTAHATITYAVWNGTLLKTRFALPGVFLDVPFPKIVNGSLWTLPFEMWCYVAVAVVGVIGLLERKRYALLIAALMQTVFILKSLELVSIEHDLLSRGVDVGAQFATGCAVCMCRKHLALRIDAMLGMLVLVIATQSLAPQFRHIVLHLSVPYLTLCLGFLFAGDQIRLPLSHDVSYGMYIYAFPIQQLGMFLFPSMFWWQNVLFATPLTVLCALASWKLVEKPSLSLAQDLRQRLKARSEAASSLVVDTQT